MKLRLYEAWLRIRWRLTHPRCILGHDWGPEGEWPASPLLSGPSCSRCGLFHSPDLTP